MEYESQVECGTKWNEDWKQIRIRTHSPPPAGVTAI